MLHRRRIAIVSSVAALAGSAAAIGALPARAASAGACQFAGPATFTSPLSTGPSYSYDFSGSLTSCAGVSGAATSGVIAAGSRYRVTVTGSGWSVTYALPDVQGTGGCAQTESQGVAVASWASGATTVIDFTTAGAAGTSALSGFVAPSATLTEVSSTGTPPVGTPATYTVSTTPQPYPAGDVVAGVLQLQSADPTQCVTAGGVSSASASGTLAFAGA